MIDGDETRGRSQRGKSGEVSGLERGGEFVGSLRVGDMRPLTDIASELVEGCTAETEMVGATTREGEGL